LEIIAEDSAPIPNSYWPKNLSQQTLSSKQPPQRKTHCNVGNQKWPTSAEVSALSAEMLPI
jgi:hypothetical protein